MARFVSVALHPMICLHHIISDNMALYVIGLGPLEMIYGMGRIGDIYSRMFIGAIRLAVFGFISLSNWRLLYSSSSGSMKIALTSAEAGATVDIPLKGLVGRTVCGT